MCDLFKAFYSGSYISSLLKKHNFYAGRPMLNSIWCFFFFGFMSRGKEGENYIISFFIDIIYLFLRESVYIETCVGREWSALNDIADSETALDTDADEYKESNLQAQEKQGGGRAFLLLGSCNFYRVSYQIKKNIYISHIIPT